MGKRTGRGGIGGDGTAHHGDRGEKVRTRPKKCKGRELVFDADGRKEYLASFRGRKARRREEARQKAEARVKAERRLERKQKRAERQARFAALQEQVREAGGARESSSEHEQSDGEDGSERRAERKRAKNKKDIKVHDSKKYRTTVTVQAGFGDDD